MDQLFEILNFTVYTVTFALLGFIGAEMIMNDAEELRKERLEEEARERLEEETRQARRNIDNTFRNYLFNLVKHRIPYFRHSYGNFLIYILDPENFEKNSNLINENTSHFDWLNDVVNLFSRRIERLFEQALKNAVPTIMATLALYRYIHLTNTVRENPYLNNRMYSTYWTFFRGAAGGFASRGGLNVGTAQRIVRWLRVIFRYFH